MIHPILFILCLLVAGVAAYYAGREGSTTHVGNQNKLLRKDNLRQLHELNDLYRERYHLKALAKRADEDTLDAQSATIAMEVCKGKQAVQLRKVIQGLVVQARGVKGLWATENPDLIRHHNKRERFFCIGHPERRL